MTVTKFVRGTYYSQNALEVFFKEIFGSGTFRVKVSPIFPSAS